MRKISYFLQNFDRPIGCRAIGKFLESWIFENRLSMLIRAEIRVIVIWSQSYHAPLKLTFFIYNIKVYNNEVTNDTTYEPLYDTTNTVPGGAIYHDYPLAFNIDLRNTTTTKYTLKYKVLNINI